MGRYYHTLFILLILFYFRPIHAFLIDSVVSSTMALKQKILPLPWVIPDQGTKPLLGSIYKRFKGLTGEEMLQGYHIT